jgi:hypothetical protein
VRGSKAGWVALFLAAAGPLSAGDRDPRWTDELGTPIETIRHWLQPEASDAAVLDHLISISPDAASLTFDLEHGKALRVALTRGQVLLDEHPVGRYAPGGPLEAGWRQFLTDATRESTPAVLASIHDWHPEGLPSEEALAFGAILHRLDAFKSTTIVPILPQAVPAAAAGGLSIDLSDLSDPALLEPALRRAATLAGPDLRVTVPGGRARIGNFSVGSGEHLKGHLLVLRGNADIYGEVDGNLATVDGHVTVHPGGLVTGDVLALGGNVNDVGGEIRGEIRTLEPSVTMVRVDAETAPSVSTVAQGFRNGAGLIGVFLTMVLLGFGLTMFARPQLEVVSDTVAHSFGRSFLVGLLGQILLLPTFGMLVVGLILSVVGILLLPFAVVAYVLLAIVAVLGGYLAVAHALGETYTRRQMALGVLIHSPNSYRYVLIGVGAMLSLWAAWVVFGWVPVAGTLIRGIAILVTWLLATAGFGAALLSRAGLREGFAGRLLPQEALTDEYLWATPQFGVPAATRPGARTPPTQR